MFHWFSNSQVLRTVSSTSFSRQQVLLNFSDESISTGLADAPWGSLRWLGLESPANSIVSIGPTEQRCELTLSVHRNKLSKCSRRYVVGRCRRILLLPLCLVTHLDGLKVTAVRVVLRPAALGLESQEHFGPQFLSADQFWVVRVTREFKKISSQPKAQCSLNPEWLVVLHPSGGR